MRRIFFTIIVLIGLCVSSMAWAEATCPTPSSKNISVTTVKNKKIYSAQLSGKPSLILQTDFDNKGPPKRFDSMMLTPISPYFVSCSYDYGDFVLKTQRHNFYDTDKTCTLVGAKPSDVQKTKVAMICKSHKVSGCKLVCS